MGRSCKGKPKTNKRKLLRKSKKRVGGDPTSQAELENKLKAMEVTIKALDEGMKLYQIKMGKTPLAEDESWFNEFQKKKDKLMFECRIVAQKCGMIKDDGSGTETGKELKDAKEEMLKQKDEYDKERAEERELLEDKPVLKDKDSTPDQKKHFREILLQMHNVYSQILRLYTLYFENKLLVDQFVKALNELKQSSPAEEGWKKIKKQAIMNEQKLFNIFKYILLNTLERARYLQMFLKGNDTNLITLLRNTPDNEDGSLTVPENEAYMLFYEHLIEFKLTHPMHYQKLIRTKFMEIAKQLRETKMFGQFDDFLNVISEMSSTHLHPNTKLEVTQELVKDIRNNKTWTKREDEDGFWYYVNKDQNLSNFKMRDYSVDYDGDIDIAKDNSEYEITEFVNNEEGTEVEVEWNKKETEISVLERAIDNNEHQKTITLKNKWLKKLNQIFPKDFNFGTRVDLNLRKNIVLLRLNAISANLTKQIDRIDRINTTKSLIEKLLKSDELSESQKGTLTKTIAYLDPEQSVSSTVGGGPSKEDDGDDLLDYEAKTFPLFDTQYWKLQRCINYKKLLFEEDTVLKVVARENMKSLQNILESFTLYKSNLQSKNYKDYTIMNTITVSGGNGNATGLDALAAAAALADNGAGDDAAGTGGLDALAAATGATGDDAAGTGGLDDVSPAAAAAAAAADGTGDDTGDDATGLDVDSPADDPGLDDVSPADDAGLDALAAAAADTGDNADDDDATGLDDDGSSAVGLVDDLDNDPANVDDPGLDDGSPADDLADVGADVALVPNDLEVKPKKPNSKRLIRFLNTLVTQFEDAISQFEETVLESSDPEEKGNQHEFLIKLGDSILEKKPTEENEEVYKRLRRKFSQMTHNVAYLKSITAIEDVSKEDFQKNLNTSKRCSLSSEMEEDIEDLKLLVKRSNAIFENPALYTKSDYKDIVMFYDEESQVNKQSEKRKVSLNEFQVRMENHYKHLEELMNKPVEIETLREMRNRVANLKTLKKRYDDTESACQQQYPDETKECVPKPKNRKKEGKDIVVDQQEDIVNNPAIVDKPAIRRKSIQTLINSLDDKINDKKSSNERHKSITDMVKLIKESLSAFYDSISKVKEEAAAASVSPDEGSETMVTKDMVDEAKTIGEVTQKLIDDLKCSTASEKSFHDKKCSKMTHAFENFKAKYDFINGITIPITYKAFLEGVQRKINIKPKVQKQPKTANAFPLTQLEEGVQLKTKKTKTMKKEKAPAMELPPTQEPDDNTIFKECKGLGKGTTKRKQCGILKAKIDTYKQMTPFQKGYNKGISLKNQIDRSLNAKTNDFLAEVKSDFEVYKKDNPPKFPKPTQRKIDV